MEITKKQYVEEIVDENSIGIFISYIKIIEILTEDTVCNTHFAEKNLRRFEKLNPFESANDEAMQQ